MTPERQNEIWAMLPDNTKRDCRRIYRREENAGVESYGRGYRGALVDIFGKHNLTAQAEDKPKEDETTQKSPSEPNLQAAKKVDYARYRLDLAKEIAVAEMNRLGSVNVNAIVQVTNKIVKRLKETEI